jgi:hypothetical protein
MPLFLIHCALLFIASWAVARRVVAPAADRLLATFLLFWGNIVVTSLLLASLHKLGHSPWFFRASVLLALAMWLALRRVVPEPALVATGGKFNRWLVTFFVLTLVPLGYISLRIACTYEPNNYDSLTYHLPRAMFYLGQNTLLHFDTGNARQIYFPFNYNLLQLFALIYSPPLQCINFLNLAAWAAAGLAVYRLGRLCALGPNVSLIACWLAVTSTQILAQGTATTNDLPTGTGLLCALVFALRWRADRRRRDALLGGLAAGLTLGTKLTVIFFAPAAGLILLGLVWQHWRRGEGPAVFRAVRAWLLPGLVALSLAAPFALINLAEKGEWINHTYDYTRNLPFTLACSLQTAEGYLVQLFLEPLHRFTVDPKFTEHLNAWGQSFFFPHWNEAYAFSPLYLFPPDLNEDHVWYGFTGPVILLCAIFCLIRFRRRDPALVWLATLGLGWFATYFLLNKWSLYNHRYFVPALLVMSPGVAAAIETGWDSPRVRRLTQWFFAALALSAIWLAGLYLFKNTSRPYAPLWAGRPAPRALPLLPPLFAARLSGQPKVNFDSTDGNERAFLFMTFGRNQRFTAFDQTQPKAYNVFSEWGFPRKVAYSNIEQRSSYTTLSIPGKRTAGVEYLGTLGAGEEALDYYGLVPHSDLIPAGSNDRNVLVVFYYQPRDPGRYANLRLKVAGLNAPDDSRLVVGVDYADNTSAVLATFSANGEAHASVTKPFRRFTITALRQDNGEKMGAIDLPYLYRDLPPEMEAPDDPKLLFADELITLRPQPHILTTGLTPAEGPYPQADLPLFRWAKSPVVRLEIPKTEQLARLEVTFSIQLQARNRGHLDVVFNGDLVGDFPLQGRTEWSTQTLSFTPGPGRNILEFRNVIVDTGPDWLDYLERYPDVKNYVLSQHVPLEQGAKAHYEAFGVHENRTLHFKRRLETLDGPNPLYYLFRNLRIDGYRIP